MLRALPPPPPRLLLLLLLLLLQQGKRARGGPLQRPLCQQNALQLCQGLCHLVRTEVGHRTLQDAPRGAEVHQLTHQLLAQLRDDGRRQQLPERRGI